MNTIWVVGSLNVDLVVGVERFPDPGETLRGRSFATFLGGKGGNQAIAVARLGGAPRMVARVGADQFGQRYLDALKEEGASVAQVAVVPEEPTGTALIEVDRGGQNRIVIVAGANGVLDESQVLTDLADLSEGDIVLLQLEIPLETVWAVIREADIRGATVILDPAPAAPIPAEVLSRIDWITPNEHEAAMITGVETGSDQGLQEAARSLLAAGVGTAVVKAGSRGAYVATRERPDPILVPGFKVDAVDTTAAGDAFNGGLAWALAQGAAPMDAVRTANAVAAISVTGMGAQTGMPERDRLEEFLRKHT